MTSSPQRALAGRQQPSITHRPPWASEASAEEAIDLASAVGLTLDPWQETVVRAALAERTDGKWAASEVGFLVARQNGKGGALEAIVLHGLFVIRDPLTLWTAHQFKTSDEAFLRIKGWIDASDDLRRMVKRMSSGATGEHGIEIAGGARLRFIARSKSSGRGFSPQRIVFDEAQELSTLSVEAMLMATSAQRNRQTIYTGTVPSAENNAEHWTSLRNRGRAGKSNQLAWAEWTPRGSDDPLTAGKVDLDDRRAWAWSNPAMGYRIAEETIASERETLIDSPESFARERLSIWPTLPEGGLGVIDLAHFAACKVDVGSVEGPMTLAVETSFDRSTTTLAVVGRRVSDGFPQVEVIDQSDGTAWVADRVVQVCGRNAIDALVIDGKSPAAPLVTEIELALEASGLDVELRVTTTADLAEACAQLFDAITGHTVRVPMVDGVTDPVLDAAVRGASQRPVGDGAWAWSRRTGGAGVTPLTAWTLALWAWRDLNDSDYDVLDSIG